MVQAESEIHLNLSIGSDGGDWRLAFFSHAVLNPFVPSAKGKELGNLTYTLSCY